MMMWIFTRKILAGEPLPVFNHGEMWRDFTYIDDIVSGVEQSDPVYIYWLSRLARLVRRPGSIRDDDDGHAPATRLMSVCRRTGVVKRSTGPACMMSSALPAATCRLDRSSRMRAAIVAPREHMRERAAELAGADDGDLIIAWAIVMAAMKTELRGQVAIVTGGSRGIGFAIARGARR